MGESHCMLLIGVSTDICSDTSNRYASLINVFSSNPVHGFGLLSELLGRKLHLEVLFLMNLLQCQV
jgi:hypothetical protein